MRIVIRDIRLPATADENDAIGFANRQLNKELGCGNFENVCIYRRSIDARHSNNITSVWSVAANVPEQKISDNNLKSLKASAIDDGELEIVYGNEKTDKRPLIVGFGPAGMFCALLLAENGYKPIVVERGCDIAERNTKVLAFREKGILDTECNIQFGAGGAGTFSDGKLVTRINDKKTGYVIKKFHQFGAPSSILTSAKPHVGTDNLGKIVTAIKDKIISLGGEVHFNTKFEGYSKIEKGIKAKTSKGDFECSSLVLAIGHSARDTYTVLAEAGMDMISKAFSVGVRVEQLQEEINKSIYGKFADKLGNAEYNFSYRKGERAVYTFCMCPGGQVVEAASEENTVVVNGMSNYKRDGKNSNAALVVSVLPTDCGNDLFDGIKFQRHLEHKAFEMGGKNYGVPIQTVGDYLANTTGASPTKVKPTYMNGERYNLTNLNDLFPKYINSFLQEGLTRFENKTKGYAPKYAVMSGVETRTSSPIRIVRNDFLVSTYDDNIYPCGEGAGYAGGITSASVDGLRVALKIMERYKPE